MSTVTATGHRHGDMRDGPASLFAGVGFVPQRARGGAARTLLDRDGAVILTGYPPAPDSLTRSAADVLGTRLRELFPIRERAADCDDRVHLHNDSHNVVADVHGRTTRFRDPDEDYVLVQCVNQASCGAASVIADGYRFVDRLREAYPPLWEFLTTVDLDFYGSWGLQRGVPATPQLCRHVEYTRGGRRVVRANQGARPLPRDPRATNHEAMLDLFADLRASLAAGAPRVPLHDGEILLVDNYRCWHGRDPHESPRLVRVMTVKTTDAM